MAISPPRLDDPELDLEHLIERWATWHTRLERRHPLTVLVRTQRLAAATLVLLLRHLRAAADDQLIVSGRVDVAAGADGVQLPERGLPADRVRKLVGTHLLIGRSVHDLDGVRRAKADGADWVTLAPIFEPLSKEGTRPALGVEALDEAARVGVPVYALGGITSENREACLRHGAHGVAGITLFDPSNV